MINKITEFSLRVPGLVLIGIVAVLALGVFQYQRMPVDAFPDTSPIMVPVFAEGHGMAPEEIERLVSYPIESAMNGLPDVTQIKSTSAFGMAVIYVYFKDSTDIFFARQLVAERLSSVMSELPDMDVPPSLGPISTGLGQIFLYYLEADPDRVDTEGKPMETWLRELNDWVVKFQLRTVPGVTDILSIGGHVLQYQIRVNPNALWKYNLTLEDLDRCEWQQPQCGWSIPSVGFGGTSRSGHWLGGESRGHSEHRSKRDRGAACLAIRCC